MIRCELCTRKLAEGRTMEGGKVLLDLEQRVYTPVDLDNPGSRVMRNQLSFAEHKCVVTYRGPAK